MIVFYIFIFLTWSLGLLSWIVFMSHKSDKWDLQNKLLKQELGQKELLFSRINSSQPSGPVRAPQQDAMKEIPEKVKELMRSSPQHPEVEEIEGSDIILGVRFEAENYPPGFGESDEE